MMLITMVVLNTCQYLLQLIEQMWYFQDNTTTTQYQSVYLRYCNTNLLVRLKQSFPDSIFVWYLWH